MAVSHMKPLTTKQLPEILISILFECFHGSEKSGAFLDPGPNGLLALLDSLSAQEASTPVAGASVAAHALHVAFSLDAFIEWIKGTRDKKYDWTASWAKSAVNEREWDELKKQIYSQFEKLKEVIQLNATDDYEAAWGASGVLAHTAYHLGAIKVKVDELRKTQ